jgi:hypothetical protein
VQKSQTNTRVLNNSPTRINILNKCTKKSYAYIQGVREWSPKNFRVSLSGRKTFIRFLDKLNRFLKIKLFPAVLGLLKYCFVHEKKSYKFRLINDIVEMCIMGCGKKKFRNTPLVNNPVCFDLKMITS